MKYLVLKNTGRNLTMDKILHLQPFDCAGIDMRILKMIILTNTDMFSTLKAFREESLNLPHMVKNISSAGGRFICPLKIMYNCNLY